jgi:hypothetical protein
MAWRKPKPESPTLAQLHVARDALMSQLAVLQEAPGSHFEALASRLQVMLDQVEFQIGQIET